MLSAYRSPRSLAPLDEALLNLDPQLAGAADEGRWVRDDIQDDFDADVAADPWEVQVDGAAQKRSLAPLSFPFGEDLS